MRFRTPTYWLAAGLLSSLLAGMSWGLPRHMQAPVPAAANSRHELRVRFTARIINVGGSALRLKRKKILQAAPGVKVERYPGVFFRGEGVPEPAHILENGQPVSAYALKFGMTVEISAFAFKTPNGYVYRATRIVVLKK